MSQEKKYQVFISSTYTDLIDARNAAINTVLESYNFPVGMEMFGADNDEQWTIIKELIDSSDFYILIMGHRYGSISKKDGISFTEKEFDYALEKGVKLMCFVRKDHVATLPLERDEDPAIKEKISRFRTKVTTDRTCEFWDSVDDLKHKISNSLYKNIRRHGGIGWVRGNQISGQLAEELAKLSEENRKLREENERIQESIKVKQPVLKVSINDIANTSIDEFDQIELFWFKLREDDYYEKPERISTRLEIRRAGDLLTTHSILGMHDKTKYIQEYNDEVDAISEIDINNHNQALRALHQLEVRSHQLNIAVENIGNNLANMLSIEIEFPNFITIIDDKSDENIKWFQKNIQKGLIPNIKTPEERQQEYMSGVLGNLGKIDYGSVIPKVNMRLSDSYSDKNTIYITNNSLLHTRKIKFDNYYIVPNAIDEGVIKINIMCAEYTDPISFEIPIVVTA